MRTIILLLLFSFTLEITPVLAGTVGYLKNHAEYFHKKENQWKAVELNQQIRDETRLRTGDTGRLEILFDGGRLVRLAQNTELNLLKTNPERQAESVVVKLVSGRLWGSVLRKNKHKRKMQIRTPMALIGIRGTQFDVLLQNESSRLKLTVLRGLIEISPPHQIKGPEEIGGPIEVEAPRKLSFDDWLIGLKSQQIMTITAGELPIIEEGIPATDMDEWIHFNQQRDQELRKDSE